MLTTYGMKGMHKIGRNNYILPLPMSWHVSELPEQIERKINKMNGKFR
jgi:hypothetical protein